MAITIRRAESRDLDKTLKLLGEVLELHAKIRPDIFISGTTKYTREELQAIFDNDQTPVFVAADDSGEVVGYAFCVYEASAVQHQHEGFQHAVHRRPVR